MGVFEVWCPKIAFFACRHFSFQRVFHVIYRNQNSVLYHSVVQEVILKEFAYFFEIFAVVIRVFVYTGVLCSFTAAFSVKRGEGGRTRRSEGEIGDRER